MAGPNGKKAPASPVVTQIATALGETQPAALGQLKQQALEREQQGGLMLPDGKRRTPGGVFFRLVDERALSILRIVQTIGKEQMAPEERRQVWFYQTRAKAAPQTEQRATG